MEEKQLGKITHAEFGQYPDHPFLFGLQLVFEGKWGGVGDGGSHTLNLNPIVWENTEKKLGDYLEQRMRELDSILKDAKCNHVSELKGKPVEVTLKNRTFQSFRILTEVL